MCQLHLLWEPCVASVMKYFQYWPNVDLKAFNWFRNITYIDKFLQQLYLSRCWYTIPYKSFSILRLYKFLISFVYLLLTQQDSNEPLFCTCVHLVCCLATRYCFHSLIGGFCVFRSDCLVLNTLLWDPGRSEVSRLSLHQWQIDQITSEWLVSLDHSISRCDPCRNSQVIKDV